jgi:pimeloyl-ACP methyl ester carboxylesterase
VTASVLEAYEAVLQSQDVYKRTLQQLKEGVGPAGDVEAWGYDWRLGAAELADALQKDLRDKFGGRDVVLLGHSYGAVVAWQWQQAHDPAAAGVEHLVLFGPPLEGTCEAVRFLIEGFGPGAGEPDDFITRVGYHLLMGELRRTAFTFPGAFQLVPEGCLEKLTVRAGRPAEAAPLAPRSLEFWKGTIGRQIMDEPWKELEITEDAFWATLERALAEAARSAPDPSRRRVRNVRAFFASQHPTARQIRLAVDENDRILSDDEVEKAGLGEDNPIVVTAPGDGRVVACDPPACSLNDVCREKIGLVHGLLADSKQFMSYARFHLPAVVKALAVRAAVRQMQRSEAPSGLDWRALRDEVAATGTDTAVFDRLLAP